MVNLVKYDIKGLVAEFIFEANDYQFMVILDFITAKDNIAGLVNLDNPESFKKFIDNSKIVESISENIEFIKDNLDSKKCFIIDNSTFHKFFIFSRAAA